MDGQEHDAHLHGDAGLTPPDALIESGEAIIATRRRFLLLGASVLLAGCAAQQTATTALPGPVWKPRDLPPEPAPPTVVKPTGGPPGLLARSRWSGAPPVPALMDRMTSGAVDHRASRWHGSVLRGG